MKARPHPQEDDRLDALRALQILDTSSEEEFDELVEIASNICNAPISLISLVDADRQWFKARIGLDASQTSLQESVCAHAILTDEPLVISDTLLDPRTRDNPLVHNEVNMRFYAGVPLKIEENLPLGTLCVLDSVPRQLSPEQLRALEVLGRQVTTKLTLRTALERERKLKLQLEQQRDELLRMNAQLNDANEGKNLFLAMLSHELRNPLSALSNGLSLIESPDQQEVQEDTIQMMQRQCIQLTRLLDDLLDVSRITRGKISLKRSTICLAPIIEDAISTFTVEAAAKQIRLEFQNVPASVQVNADAARLLQVIVNLLHNAIRYTPFGGRIELSTTVSSDSVQIRIADTGQGISAQDLDKIFELFVQLDNTSIPANHGLGLGLALVNELVHLHGGSVAANSDGPGLGSTFSVQLPLATAVIENTVKEVAAPEADSTAGLDLLIIDDNVDSIRALGRLLERRHHQVRLASTGMEALEAFTEQKPDVVLLDIGLPDVSGHDVARRLRQDYPDQNLLLIATTGYGQAEDLQQSEDAGFDHHLTKPVDLTQLKNLLNEHQRHLQAIRRA